MHVVAVAVSLNSQKPQVEIKKKYPCATMGLSIVSMMWVHHVYLKYPGKLFERVAKPHGRAISVLTTDCCNLIAWCLSRMQLAIGPKRMFQKTNN